MIIAHNKDYEIFQKILSKSIVDLQNDSKLRANYYINRGGVSLEKDVYEFVNKYSEGLSSRS